ncbi:MAG: bifunctional demethylmenaquinone methyltransferase/2-methoxy-6-polyprenyl-1,4-benzoquinol methylase UbiE [Neisseriales bacterium]|nr:MAG: bifunctional demethylmenaquinone methyltransferase/2-methoxy-6-polyprenyl-1,4-benzoquinol methylase UbiE [Neisseriales bacterium]
MAYKKTHFGFQQIDECDKNEQVAKVFHQVSAKYDLMNDVMSGGLHRLWKRFTVTIAMIRPEDRILDMASGTGDLAIHLSKKLSKKGELWCADINCSMLHIGRNRLLNKGLIVPLVNADAEAVPFQNNYFDCIVIAFGLRNMTRQDQALKEMYRVLKPKGRLIILEFSKVHRSFFKLYQFYTLKALPLLGKWIANDQASYRYLGESISVHPDQNMIKEMMIQAGFCQVSYFNLSAGIVALHKGFKRCD